MAEDGAKPPPASAFPPEITIAAQEYFDAWRAVSRTRFWTDYGSPQPVTRAEIREYLDDARITDPEERSDIVRWVLWSDETYRVIYAEMSEKKRKSKDTPKSTSTRR